MSEPFRQHLPDPAAYRAEFIAAGVALPLPATPWRADGLLTALPPAPTGRHGWPWDVQTSPPALVNVEGLATSPADWPLITVVIPSFRQGEFLEETIRSVLLQNYPRLEIALLDGGSTDASPALIEKYRPWLGFARLARDRGQAHAINLGFSLGSGDIFGWINSDDYLLPGTLRRVAEAWRAGAEFIYGDSLDFDQAANRLRHSFANLAHARYVRFAGLVPQAGAFWSSARHRPLWEEQHCALDYELWIRLLPGLRLRHLLRPLAVARQHGAAKTYNPVMKQRWAEDARRNGLAHPELYRNTLRARLLAHEYRVVQRLWRAWHGRGLTGRLESIRRESGWMAAPSSH